MPKTLSIKPDDPRLTWAGAVSFDRSDGTVMPWRIPFEQREFFGAPLQVRSAFPAGVRIAFRSDTTLVAGRVKPPEQPAVLDLCVDGEFHSSVDLTERAAFSFEDLPAGEKLVELWLPQFAQFRLEGIELDDGATIEPYEDSRPKWTTYGSSITHCAKAERPTQTWPAIVARGHGLNLTCLGYGGSCLLEASVARIMRDIPADFLSMKVGINIQSTNSLGPRTFRSAVIGFVQIVREKHPDAPFVVVSPILSPPRETTPNLVGLSLSDMRNEIAEAVEALRAHGDANIHYVDGLRVFGSDQVHLLPDEVHPDAEGYKVLGQNFLREVARPLFTG